MVQDQKNKGDQDHGNEEKNYPPRTFTSDRNSKRVTLLLIAIVVSIAFGCLLNALHVESVVIRKLDDKKATVLTLTTVTAATATAIAAIPDDMTTPIADQLMELADYAIVIFLIIMAEKYLAASAVFLSFQLLFPLSFILLSASIRFRKQQFRRLAYRLIILAVCFLLIVPISLLVEDSIDSAFNTSESIRIVTHEDAIEAEMAADENASEEEKASFFEAAGNFFTGIFNKAKNLGADAVNMLNGYVDAFVALIFKDCVMPILTFLLLYLICKHLFASILPESIKEDTRKLAKTAETYRPIRYTRAKLKKKEE